MEYLSPHRLQLQEYVSPTYGVVLDGHQLVKLAAMLKPNYWQHHATKLRPGDKIEVRTEGNVYYAELLVIDTGPQAAKVKVLMAVGFSKEGEDLISLKDVKEEDIPEEKGYEVKWVGPIKKYGVRREGDKDWTITGFATKDEAKKWAAGDKKSMAA